MCEASYSPFNDLSRATAHPAVLITFALPGKKGHHHVNCNTQEYWIDVFDRYGFTCDLKVSNKIRKASTMNINTKGKNKAWVRNTGLFFVKR